MAKNKKNKKEEETPFDLKKALAEVNPMLREGLEIYIFNNQIKVSSQKEFKELLEKYGGF